jgi:hypothetical protein
MTMQANFSQIVIHFVQLKTLSSTPLILTVILSFHITKI